MASYKSAVIYSMLVCVTLSLFMVEVEARRKILRGRKTITRTYYRRGGLAAWAVVVLIGMGMLACGGAMYAVMRKIIIQTPAPQAYAPANQIEP